jgi:hypothetical protein
MTQKFKIGQTVYYPVIGNNPATGERTPHAAIATVTNIVPARGGLFKYQVNEE